jgi:integrase
MARKAWTWIEVKKINKPGFHRDRGDGAARGLYCQVTPSAAKARPGEFARSWVYRFVSPTHRRSRWMGLGPLDVVSLEEARERARAARKLVKSSQDPIDQRNREAEVRAVEAAKHKTFAEVANQYLKAHAHDWKSPKHAAQWETSLTKEAKVIANLPIASINTAHVLEVLEPIWRVKPETASRVRGRIERVLAYAMAAEYRRREDGNPARWDGHLQELLGSKAKAQKAKRNRTGKLEHFKALPYAEVPEFMAKLRANKSISARALEWTILTACRTGDTIGARWSEIDVAEKVWTIPAERMKAEREHRVPLSKSALAILETMPHQGGYIFTGIRGDKPISNMAMLEMVRGMIGNGFTTHGFRSCFKDWARARSYRDELSELALAHIEKNKVKRAYAREDLLEERRPMMETWAAYCSAPSPAGEVVPLRKVRP